MLISKVNTKEEDLDLKFISFYKSFFKNKNKYYFLCKKFFCFKQNVQEYPEEYVKKYFLEFFDNFFIIQKEIQWKKNLFYLYLYLKNNYTTYRFFYGYPNNLKRTRCNYSSSKNKQKNFRTYLIRYVYHLHFNRVSRKNKITHVIFEFFNKWWYFFWKKEWSSAKESFELVKIKKHVKYKYAEIFTMFNRAITFEIKKTVKKNRKKVNIPNNIFNIGFDYGFFFQQSVFKKLKNIKKILCVKRIIQYFF